MDLKRPDTLNHTSSDRIRDHARLRLHIRMTCMVASLLAYARYHNRSSGDARRYSTNPPAHKSQLQSRRNLATCCHGYGGASTRWIDENLLPYVCDRRSWLATSLFDILDYPVLVRKSTVTREVPIQCDLPINVLDIGVSLL